MLIEQTHYPLGEGENFPWLTVITILVIIGILYYLTLDETPAQGTIKQPNQ